MRAEELREMAVDELRSRLAEMQEEQFRLRFRSATESLEDPLRFRVIRKEIARMKTVLRERQPAQSAPAASRPADR